MMSAGKLMLMLVCIRVLTKKLEEEDKSISLIACTFSNNVGLGSCGDRRPLQSPNDEDHSASN